MNYSPIFVNRIGKSADSFMRTIKLLRTIDPNKWVKIKSNQLVDAQEDDFKVKQEMSNLHINEQTESETGINCVSVPGRFVKTFLSESTENNILGKNDWFLTKIHHISIPETKTTKKTLGFFGCTLIEPECPFKLSDQLELPVFEVSIGSTYVQDYLLEENFGNGFYIETHNTPHYHQPLSPESSGYLILGVFIGVKIVLSKFAIPYGYGVYMPANTLHSDAFLVGDYAVVYTKTPDYSTYLFKTPDGKIVQVE